MTARKLIVLICALAAISCAPRHRVSRGVVNGLLKRHEPFVLVFGSMSMLGEAPPPTIRFVHQFTRTAPRYELYALTISSGDRFYAILRRPPALERLDEFEVEVGAAPSAFDRIAYVKLPRGGEAHALYVGEIRMTPA